MSSTVSVVSVVIVVQETWLLFFSSFLFLPFLHFFTWVGGPWVLPSASRFVTPPPHPHHLLPCKLEHGRSEQKWSTTAFSHDLQPLCPCPMHPSGAQSCCRVWHRHPFCFGSGPLEWGCGFEASPTLSPLTELRAPGKAGQHSPVRAEGGQQRTEKSARVKCRWSQAAEEKKAEQKKGVLEKNCLGQRIEV